MKDLIQYPDFEKLDIRVGQIKEVVEVENSKKLLSLMVDLGEIGIVEILSGIKEFVVISEIIGMKVPVLVNLEPKKMAGKVSNGMILMGDTGHSAVLIPVLQEIPNGSVIR